MGMYRTVGRSSLILVLGLSVVLTGCSRNTLDFDPTVVEGSAGAITIAAPPLPEGRLLAELYGEVLAENSYDVTYNFGLDSRALYLQALGNDTVDIVPDYSGDVLRHLAPAATEKSFIDVSLAAKKNLSDLGLVGLDPSGAENRRAFVVSPDFATSFSVTSMLDLANFARTLVIATPEGMEVGGAPRVALEKQYSLNDWTPVEFPPTETEAILAALDSGEIDIVVLESGSPVIEARGLVVLEDPSAVFTANNIMPIVTSDRSSRSLILLLDSVSDALTSEALRALVTHHYNERAPGDATIARDWLIRQDLISP
jgi:osmoprotectant transport system substrate-binding protein